MTKITDGYWLRGPNDSIVNQHGTLIASEVFSTADADLIKCSPDMLELIRLLYFNVDALIAMLVDRVPNFKPTRDADFALAACRAANALTARALGAASDDPDSRTRLQ